MPVSWRSELAGWKRLRVEQYRPHLLVLFALAIVVASGWKEGLQSVLTDARFGWATRPASGNVVLVAIDPVSIERVGSWPWSRATHARLIGQLERAGARDIAFDIDFSAVSDAASDAKLEQALRAAGGSVILPSFRQAPKISPGDSKASYVNRPVPALAAQSWSALVNVEVERDGRVRRYPFGERIDGELVPSMAALLAGQPNLSRSPFFIDFGIKADTVPLVSYIDVLEGAPGALESLKGKQVIVGATALELGDRFSVPNSAVITGPLLQILATESLSQERALYRTSDYVTAAGLATLILIMMLSWRISAGKRVALLVVMSLAAEAAGLVLQIKFPVVLDTALFQTAILGYFVAIALDEIDLRGLLAHVANKRFQQITMSLGDGVVCASPDGRITMWNPGAQAIFGYRMDEAIGQPFELICASPGQSGTFSLMDLPQDLLQAPGGCVYEFEGRRQNGELFPLEACLSGWHGTDGFHYGASLRDISARKREVEKIRHLAEHDPVTDLPNRIVLQRRLGGLSEAGNQASLLAVRIDNLEQATLMYGHSFGDLLLKAAAKTLLQLVGESCLVARFDGDAFAILAPETDRACASALSEKCHEAFAPPLTVGGRPHLIRISVGIAAFPEDAATTEQMLSNAHLALMRAKASTRPVFYSPSFRQDLEQRLSTEADLQRALSQNEFELFFQPQVSLADHSVIGAEALIRWRHPTRGLVPPALFMPIVNNSPISNSVAGWVLRTACMQASVWARDGHRVRIGVNLSPSQLATGDLAADVAKTLREAALDAPMLELEVTEDILLDDAEKVLGILRRLREIGVRVVFDDFGTGYGSLSYLKTFPLDGLKIDRSFVGTLPKDHRDAAIVSSTINLSRELGLSVIAEGIEDKATAVLLAKMGCKEGQGYFFGRPCPAAEFWQTHLSRPAENMPVHAA